MRIENEIKLDYKDVLIRPKRSTLKSRKEVDLNRTYKFKNSGQEWTGIPIMAANMDGIGTFNMAIALSDHSMFTCLTKQYSWMEWNEFYDDVHTPKNIDDFISISIGTNKTQYATAMKIIERKKLQWVCIDIANGYSEHFVDFVRQVRDHYPKINIIAGNVVTADMTQELILAGADVVKVGIGPGSVCTTRIQTGVGYPQLSAVIECADAAHGLGGHIIADGGCTCPGDVAKAFAAGADFVMLGGMLAGHKEGGGELCTLDGNNVRRFYGMSSDTAMNKHSGGVADYRSSEGRTVFVPDRGEVRDTVLDILGGLRSTCTYVGAPTLKQLSKCTTFVRCTQQFNGVFVR
jgi:GMP reductase